VVISANIDIYDIYNNPKGSNMELKENVKEKLAEAVELWDDEHLIGKPAILANAIYFQLENVLIEKQKEIQDKF